MEWTEEFLERLIRTMPVGDVRAAVDEDNGRLAAVAEFAADDLATVMIAADGMVQVEFTGIGGYVEAWRDWVEPFDTYRVEMEEIREGPEGLLVLIRQWSTPRGTTAEIEAEGAAVLKFTGDRLARVEFHLGRGTALRSAGLAEPRS